METSTDPALLKPSMNCAGLRMGVKASRKSKARLFRHGVAILRGGNVIATGWNASFKHAEVNAINKIHPEKRNNLVVWSLRTTKGNTKISQARPCPDCLNYLINNGVKKIYYSTTEGEIRVIKVLANNEIEDLGI